MTPDRRDTLVLTLPPEPGLVRLVRLVCQRFFRQNGVRALESRRQARRVVERCRAVWRSAPAEGAERGRSAGASPIVLTLVSRAGFLEAIGRRDARRGPSRLVRIERSGPG